MAPALETRGLTKTYGSLTAVEPIDFELEAGVVLGFLGPNGAGKTTLIRMVTTILRPTGGSFSVAGVPSDRPNEIRRRIGALPESAGYPDGQTGDEFLRYHARLYGQTATSARSTSRALLTEVGLAERGGSLVSAYSRGMRQRLGIARALVNDPQVVFLDEPTLGLDPAGQRQILAFVGRIARERGATVVLSTHLLSEVEETCDRVLILHHGRVVANGTVAEVAERAAAPSRARIRVPSELRERALATLADSGTRTAAEGARPDEVELTIPPGSRREALSADALRKLLAADIPVLGLELERGRLSDAFLEMTETA
ncbi:MAG: ABC transporter ATP-binding protein [Actinomycetota bacterium]